MARSSKIFAGALIISFFALFTIAFQSCTAVREDKLQETLKSPVVSDERGVVAEPGAGDTESERMRITTFQIVILADDLVKTADRVKSIVEKTNGYVESENYGSDETGKLININLVLRVPDEKSEDVVKEIKNSGRVKFYSRSSADVTEQFTQTEIKLKSLYEELERLKYLYVKADKISDVLAIEKEISRVTNEIEVLENEKRSIEQQVNYSLISLSIELPPRISSGFDFVRDFLQVIVDYLFYALRWLAQVLGFLLPFAALLLVIWLVKKIFDYFRKG